MSTVIVSVLIFGSAGYIIYDTYLKKGSKRNCESCDCPAKAAQDRQAAPKK